MLARVDVSIPWTTVPHFLFASVAVRCAYEANTVVLHWKVSTSLLSLFAVWIQADARVIWDYMAKDGRGGAASEIGKMDRFSSPEEEEAMALETLGVAGIAAMGPQVRLSALYLVNSWYIKTAGVFFRAIFSRNIFRAYFSRNMFAHILCNCFCFRGVSLGWAH